MRTSKFMAEALGFYPLGWGGGRQGGPDLQALLCNLSPVLLQDVQEGHEEVLANCLHNSIIPHSAQQANGTASRLVPHQHASSSFQPSWTAAWAEVHGLVELATPRHEAHNHHAMLCDRLRAWHQRWVASCCLGRYISSAEHAAPHSYSFSALQQCCLSHAYSLATDAMGNIGMRAGLVLQWFSFHLLQLSCPAIEDARDPSVTLRIAQTAEPGVTRTLRSAGTGVDIAHTVAAAAIPASSLAQAVLCKTSRGQPVISSPPLPSPPIPDYSLHLDFNATSVTSCSMLTVRLRQDR